MRAVTTLFFFTLVCLATSRVVQWTNAGGTPLWYFAANWDCNCIPTLSDDVVIDVANIQGSVTIGGEACFANSLTVGGTSSFVQILNIHGPLTIGNGGAKINPNGLVYLDTASPLTVSGVFQGASNFFFNSGSLAGKGSFVFHNVNFTGGALKIINATTTADFLQIVPGTGNTGSVNIASQTLTVTTNAYAAATINVYSDAGASLNIKGTFTLNGASTDSATFRGDATIGTLNIVTGTVILSDNVDVTSTTVSSGAILTLIGGTTSTRNFKDITGAGTVDIQGGTNNFDTLSDISSIILEGGGVLNTNGQSVSIGSLQQTGGTITGTSTISFGTLGLINAVIQGPTITATNLNIAGFANIVNAALTVTNLGVISKSSSITLANAALFQVGPNAKVSQSGSFKLLPSGTDQPPLFTNNGQWTSSSDFQLVVGTRGTGSFQLGPGSTLTLNGISFNTNLITITGATFTASGALVTVNSISGTGGSSSVVIEGNTFDVGTITVDSFVQTTGSTVFTTGTFGSVDLQTGSFNITGSGATISNLLFEGGQISGNNPSGTVTVTITNSTLTGNQPKTFSDLTANIKELHLKCGVQQCQLFTQSSTINTGGSSYYSREKRILDRFN